MTEINEAIPMENEATEALADMASETGTDMVVGGGIGVGIGSFVGSKLGYGKAIRDAAKATGKDPKALLAEIKAAKKQDKPKGKWHLRNPFYREEATDVSTSNEPKADDNAEEEEQNPKPAAKKTRKSK